MRHINIIEDTFPDSENVRNDVEHFFRSRLVYHTHSQSITLSGVCSTSVSKHQFDLLRYHIFGQNVAKLLPNCKPANLYTLKIRGVICLEYTKKRKQLSWQSRNRGCIKTVNISSLIPLSCLCFVCVISKTRGGTSMWVMWNSSDLVVAPRYLRLYTKNFGLTWGGFDKTLPILAVKYHIAWVHSERY